MWTSQSASAESESARFPAVKALTVINWEEEEDGPSSAANHIS
jgi:hypothetical protein